MVNQEGLELILQNITQLSTSLHSSLRLLGVDVITERLRDSLNSLGSILNGLFHVSIKEFLLILPSREP